MHKPFVIGALLLLAAAGAHATVVVPATIGELARDAHAIVRGRVVAVDARWSDDRRAIETIVTLETEAYLKGALGETLQFRVPGGTLGRFRSIIVGAPQFAVGQRVIVFLGTHGPTVPFVLGLGQGVFRVVADRNGDPIVTPPAIMPAPDGPVVRGSLARQPAPLANFERDIRALVAGVQ